MDAAEITDVCRLCPSTVAANSLLNVFDERLSVKNNMREVILVTTGIEIMENDLISKKICQRCCNITLKMFQFRQDALKQDRALRERCSQILGDKGIRLPNSCITIKQEKRELYLAIKNPKDEPALNYQTLSSDHAKEGLHSSIKELYQKYPHLKLPKTCVDRHMAPVVSLPMGEVERYFKKRKLDMNEFIAKKKVKLSGSVAKKRTGVSSKSPKMVSPLKISKTVFDNHEKTINTSSSYICTPVHKKKIRKGSTSSDKNSKGKAKLTSEPKQIESKNEKPDILMYDLNDASKSTISGEITPPKSEIRSIGKKCEMHSDNVESEILLEPDSDDSTASKVSDFFGQTPTITATKYQPLLVCNLCGSVHNNAFELKRHSLKHMVCQFCKLRFKSLDAKQTHIDHVCEVKKILNSSGPIVQLEKVHLNLEIRNKFKDAFSSFEPISSDEKQESLSLDSANKTDVIILSDDDDVVVYPTDRSDANTPHSSNNNIASGTAIVKPDIRIKFNYNLNKIGNNLNMNSTMLIKDLIKMLKPKANTVEKMLQTDLPSNREIKINHAEGFCEFKGLKDHLLTYKIPVNVENGSFNVGYLFKEKPYQPKKTGSWDYLPVRDFPAKNSETSKSLNIAQVSSAGQSNILSTSPRTSAIRNTPTLSPSGLSPSVSNTTRNVTPPQSSIPLLYQPNNSVVINSSLAPNSASSRLQTLALNVNPSTSKVINPVQFPQTNAGSAKTNRAVYQIYNKNDGGYQQRTETTHSMYPSSYVYIQSNDTSTQTNSLPSSVQSNISGSPQASLPNTIVSQTPPGATIFRVQTPTPSVLNSTVHIPPSIVLQSQPVSTSSTVPNTSTTTDTSKFRVKNVWELR